VITPPLPALVEIALYPRHPPRNAIETAGRETPSVAATSAIVTRREFLHGKNATAPQIDEPEHVV
jgi:hypothetical protein